MQRMAPQQRGKWDDLIAWLKRFEELLDQWRKNRAAAGLFHHMTEYQVHARAVETIASAINWTSAKDKDKARTMQWIPVGEAWMDLIHEMEGSHKYADVEWADHAFNLRLARNWFEHHNEPEESPVKY